MEGSFLGVHAFDGIEAYAVQANLGSVPVLGVAFHHDDGVDVMLSEDEGSVADVIAGPCPFGSSFCASMKFLDGWRMNGKPSEMIELFEEMQSCSCSILLPR